MVAIEICGLSRVFKGAGGDVTALTGIDLTVPDGQIVGLLGSNGAGKTTLVKILSTLLLPSSGAARVAGYDVVRQPRQVREKISVVFGGDRGFYGRLSGRDNLSFFGMLRGLPRRALAVRVDEALAAVGLADAAGRRVETYSRGMRQRLHIAAGLIEVPQVLLLDEPTIGLDPIEAERLRGTIARLRDSAVTVLITSHQLLDIERLADRVVLLHKGTVEHDLPLPEFCLLSSHLATVRIVGVGPPPEFGDLDDVAVDGDVWTARVRVTAWDAQTLHWLGSVLSGGNVIDMKVQAPRLEDVYGEVLKDLA